MLIHFFFKVLPGVSRYLTSIKGYATSLIGDNIDIDNSTVPAVNMERLQLNMNALDEEKDIFVSLLTVFFSFWFVFNERHDALTAFSVSL